MQRRSAAGRSSATGPKFYLTGVNYKVVYLFVGCGCWAAAESNRFPETGRWTGRAGLGAPVGSVGVKAGSACDDLIRGGLLCCYKLITLYKRGVAGPAEYINSPIGGEGHPRSCVITVKTLLSALSNTLSPTNQPCK